MSKLYDGFTDYLEGPDCFAKRVSKKKFLYFGVVAL